MRDLSDREIQFIKDNIISMPTRKLAEEFSLYFEPIGQTQLRRMMKKYGIKNPRKEPSMLPVGTERYSKYYDCIIVKVEEISVAGLKDKNLRNKQWKLKQNLIWEQTNNRELPPKWVVIFLDGDRTNYDPDNLYAVPLQIAGTIEKMKMHSENKDVYKTALIWGELYFALMENGVKCQEYLRDPEIAIKTSPILKGGTKA